MDPASILFSHNRPSVMPRTSAYMTTSKYGIGSYILSIVRDDMVVLLVQGIYESCEFVIPVLIDFLFTIVREG